MNALISAVVTRPRPTLLVLAVLIVTGIASYISIPKEAEPDIPIPLLYVNVIHEGISPEDAERLLIRPMEQELRTIEGLKEMRATAAEGSGVLILEFEAGFDPEQALGDVREKVDLAKAELPTDSEEPIIREINIALFPVLVVMLHGNVPERTLVTLARNLRDTLEGLPGVLQADIGGDREELVEIIVDPVAVESYNLSYEDIYNVVQQSNRLVAAGALDTGQGRFSVKVPGVFEGLEDMFSLPIKTDGLGTVTFADVATVRRTFKDPTGYARIDGERAVALEVTKRLGTNMIEVVDEVRDTVLAAQAEWPENIQVTFTQDRSTQVRIMLSDLANNVALAILLVMIVILGALGLRSASLVGISIPGAFLTGILAIYALGYSMNIVVLFALIMAIGLLVDGAIVVVELAERNLDRGYRRTEAYVRAARRMAWPITASTATTLAAFLPLLFWPGMVGEFMKYMPITLLATLTASLAMALLFVPTVGSLIGKRRGPKVMAEIQPGAEPTMLEEARRTFENVSGGTAAYVSLLRRALAHPAKVLAIAVALLAGSIGAYAGLGRGFEFFPEIEPEIAMLNIHARGDLSVDERDQLVRSVEERILEMPEFDSVYARSGIQLGNDVAEDIIGRVQVDFVDWWLRRPAEELFTEIRSRTADIAGIVVEPQADEAGPIQGKPIDLELSSQRPELLGNAVAMLRAGLDEIGDIIDITDTRPVPGIDWTMDVDREQAARFGANIATVGSSIQLVTNGILIGDYRPDDADDEVDIRVRFPDDDRTLSQLDRLRVMSAVGAVPVGNFLQRVAAPRVGNLQRTDGVRVMSINADVPDGILADDKIAEIEQWLVQNPLDPAVNVAFKGEDEEQRQAEEFLTRAFAIALFLMAIILVTQFNSFYQALLILSAVLFSTVGVLLALLLTDQPFGVVMSGIGVIALAGIVVNNNIVLIDTYNAIRATVPTAVEAALLACAQRLRPVLLTTVTTILGLSPMVLGMNVDLLGRNIDFGGPSTQWWTQLATAVAGGLAFATLLTLVLTPCLLVLGDRFGQGSRRARKDALASSS